MDIGYAWLLLIAAGAAFTQGFSGFGYGIVLMAVLSILNVDLERASVFATLTSLVLVVTLLVHSRKHLRVDWKQAAAVAAGLVVTMPLGYRFVLRYGDMPVFRIVFGLFLVLFALDRACRPHLKRHISPLFAPVFGAVSGLLSGAFATGGPPVVLYLYAQEDDPRTAVGTVQAVFLGTGISRLIVILAGERGLSGELLGQGLWMAPIVILATLLGYRVARLFPLRPFLLVVYGLIVLAGALNVMKGILG